jgi:hypothetical protein
MEQRRWVLVGVAAALVVTMAVFLAVRDPGGSGRDVAASGTTTTDPTTTTETTTTTVTPTTAPPTTVPPVTSSTSPPVPATTTVPPGPPFQASIEPVTAEQLGASWTPGMGCAAPEQLRAVNVSYWGYDGAVSVGRLIVDATYADDIVAVFRDIYAARFPIERMVPIDAYGGDDQASMRANNTSGYNCRTVAGSTKLSQHAYGRAIDVNPLVNPYVKGSTVDPPEGAPYADRSRNDPGMIHAGDAVVKAFARQGWGWGGSWSGGKDYQHFSSQG